MMSFQFDVGLVGILALTLSSVVCASPVGPARSARPADVDGRSFDLVVIGGTPGGIACAVRSAREGLTVLLVNHTRHIGGFITSGAGGWEAPYDGLRSPLYAEMRLGAADYYRETYGEGSPQHLSSLPDARSNAHIDRAKIEPRIAELLFNRMVEREKNLTTLTGFFISAAERDGVLLKAVTLREMKGERTCRVSARVFADCMYEGDLAAAAKAPYRVGREARSEYDEPHAGVVYTKERHKERGQLGFPKDASDGRLKIRYNSHATGEVIMPDSTGEADGSVMAYNFRPILTENPSNRVMVAKPANYDPAVAKAAGSGGFVPDIPNGKAAWNSGRLIGPQNEYPEGDWPTRERISRQYLDAVLMRLWYLQNDRAVSEKERAKWKDYGLAKDEFPDNGHVPYEIYVREARRIVGRHVFTEHDGVVAPGIKRTPVYPDSIAITDWPLDSVACLKRTVPGGNLDGIFFLGEESRPAQVPYRSLLPQGLDNLLVPVALSASHAGWGCIRLEPVWMQTGESAGFAAALSVKHKTAPAQLDSDLLVRTLVENRVTVSFFNDCDVTSNELWTPAVQFLGTKGFFNSYDACPEKPLTADLGKRWAEVFGKLAAGEFCDATAEARSLPDTEPDSAAVVTGNEFVTLLKSDLSARKLDCRPVDIALSALTLNPCVALSRGNACRLVYLTLGSLPSANAAQPALLSPPVNVSPGPGYADDTRLFQGIPGIERAANGRLWALWYAGGPDEPGEGPGNYVVLVTSTDDGKSWSGPKLVIDPPGPVRAYDPCLWHDPDGRLWLFWAQSYKWWDGRSGVWCVTTDNSSDESPRWSAPRRLCNGIMMNKPTALSSGEWLLPAAVWASKPRVERPYTQDLGGENGANVIVSKDRGATWSFLGQAIVPKRVFDEHMVVERLDGSLWVLVRTSYGIGESVSTDRGATWSDGKESGIPHVNSRFFIRRLKSGKLLSVTHNPPDKKTRSHLVARVSDDDGRTWKGGLMIDECAGISYPDGVQASDGVIYLIYDYSRSRERQILMATFTEEDVIEGKWHSSKARQRVLVNQATGARKPAPIPKDS